MTDGEVTETEAAYDPTTLEGVPEAGRARLEQNKAGLFTSDLSVNEFLLIRQAGFDPVGLVVGSSIYHIGIQMAGWKTSRELTVLSEAMYNARQLAMTRMEEEADQLGADGVVGVRLDIGRYEWGQDMAEFIAIGTAIKHREGKLHRAPSGRPFTSDLSGQDFWTLLRTGHRPVGMVMGSCVYHVAHRGALKSLAPGGSQRRARELHPGALRRSRAGDDEDAERGPGSKGRGHRGRAAAGEEPRLGQPHRSSSSRSGPGSSRLRTRRPKSSRPPPCST